MSPSSWCIHLHAVESQRQRYTWFSKMPTSTMRFSPFSSYSIWVVYMFIYTRCGGRLSTHIPYGTKQKDHIISLTLPRKLDCPGETRLDRRRQKRFLESPLVN